jgi:RHS repeat-associated protein
MSIAAKFGDPVAGIDIHMVMVPTPAPVPTPLPHPFVGVVFDPIGAAVGAAIGAVLSGGGPVFVNGMPTGNTGTDVKGYPHFPTPPGTAPAPNDPPANEGTIILGSKTVKFAGSSQGRLGSVVMSCSFPVSLPTSVCLAVPMGPPVNIGGPDAIDFLAAVTRGIRTKWVSDKLHKLAKAKPGSAKSKIICFLTGHPVDVVTGELIADAVDFELPGLLPISWERNYRSRQTVEGALGPGWYHPFDEWVEDTPRGPRLFLGEGRLLRDEYTPLEIGEEHWDGEERFWLERTREGYERRTIDGRTFFYGKAGGARHRLLRIVDRSGNAITLSYERDYLVRIVDTAGRALEVGWTRRGRIAAITFEGQPLVRYEYDDENRLVAAYDPLGHAIRYRYRGGVMVQETTRRGVSFFFDWDWAHTEGWCVRTWGEDGDKIIYDRRILYDKHRHVTRVEDGRGGISQYWGNAAGLVDQELDPSGGITKYTYDDAFRKTSETDPLGHVQEWRYDAWGNCIEEIDAAGNVMRRTFDDQHQLVELEEPSEGGNDRIVWKIEYDATGQPAWVIDPLGNATHYRYDRHGRLIKVDDPMGRSLDLAWSSRHDLESVTDAEGRVERFGHDALGQMAWSQDAAGRTTRATRDAAGNVTYLERADGERLSMRHDPDGNVIEQIDSQGRRIEMAYFGTGQLRRHVDPMGYEVRFDYDGEEDLTAVVNQAGEKYRFQRDKAGRVRTEIGFDGKRTRLIYDVAGRTERTVGPDYLITYLDRDPLGRLTGLRAGTMPGQEEEERFAYDARGNLVMTATSDVEIAFERDALGQVVREERRVKEGDRVAIESRYDKSGLRTERETTLGHRASYEWDRAGELRAITMGYASFLKTSALEKLGLPQLGRPDWTMEIIRDRAGEEIVRKMSGGVVAIWKRDAQGRPAERQVLTGVRPGVSPGRDVLHTEYAWTSPEQIGALVDKLTGGQTAFSYDARGHLIRQTLPTGETVHRMSDAVGNLYRTPDMSDARYGPGGVLLSARGTEYKHDGHGNLTEKRLADGAVWKYHWTHTGRLREVERPDGKKVTFAYDPLGRRIEKRFDGEVTEYIWDGDELVHERGRKEGERPLLTTWLFEPGRAAPIAAQVGSAREGLVDDHLGTPILAATDAGAIAWSHQLDVYGVPRPDADAHATASWRYPGQQADAETGLVYNHFRYYDPELGRFISVDPLSVAGGEALYGYVHDPVTWLDPDGLKKCRINKKTKDRLLEKGSGSVPKPHMHHIVMEGAFTNWGKKARGFVTKSRTILRKVGISLQGDFNVVWARHGDHSAKYAEAVYKELAKASPGGKKAVAETLKAIGDALATGKPFRGL